MTTTPFDPLATRHDGTTDPDDQAPVDAHTQRLRDENRALRELLAAQVQTSMPRPSLFKRLGWALISAPGAALMGWRSLLGLEDATPITGKRVGYATLTLLYTLAIYGALVLLVASWSTPNAARTGVNAAGPVRVPLDTPPKETEPPPTPAQAPESAPPEMTVPANATEDSATRPTSANAALAPARAPALATTPKPTPRIPEIPAENPLTWLDGLKSELARCATLGFFERPNCTWAARKQYCGPNRGWSAVKEYPSQPLTPMLENFAAMRQTTR